MTKHSILLSILVILFLAGCTTKSQSDKPITEPSKSQSDKPILKPSIQAKDTIPPTVDTLKYYKKTIALANGDTTGRWPVKHQPYPAEEAILPYHRIVAFYGNLYSRRMGILGELPPKEMWEKLNAEVKAWETADSTTPVIPAIHYIAVVAKGEPMKDKCHCSRMPDIQIDSALTIAKMGDAIVFLDIQVGQSNVQAELPRLEKYLKLPQVHLAIDPEFSMKDGSIPGKRIGTMDASDVNFCSEFLAHLVHENNLPPKILIVHRFTKGMLTNSKSIELRPEVQVIINMDGWGAPALKKDTYKQYVFKEPVQFTGFKLFYKNDLKKAPHRMLTPEELLQLRPQPIYIQYQ